MAQQPEYLRSVESVHNEREVTLAHRYGGFYWGADFMLLGSILGGWMGARFHRHIDHQAVLTS